jgi:hypothetical protein
MFATVCTEPARPFVQGPNLETLRSKGIDSKVQFRQAGNRFLCSLNVKIGLSTTVHYKTDDASFMNKEEAVSESF